MNWDVVIGVGIAAALVIYIRFALLIAEKLRQGDRIRAMEDWIDAVEEGLHQVDESQPVERRK